MSSRDFILNSIKNSKPEKFSLPEDYSFLYEDSQWVEAFKTNAEKNGAKISFIHTEKEISDYIQLYFNQEKRIINTLQDAQSLGDLDPHSFHDVELVVVKGLVGVAENAAIWFTETEFKNRVLPFITQNLLVVLRAKDIVPLMHEVYERIENTDAGFSIFISGPSKTADIEQSLVIGAHGSRSHHILIWEEET
ncbi:LUD domain-containing protein [Elizabethkingia sp. JS20170427COW]|uniref:LutC/YkgG family protein n=1 Tax=Elizabethkingia sp. JS20170427COW TaxID=2583851 RepID=UPI00110FFB9A|nr:LUD domain-containing protein [Elizabethkingia sp. JS20170427COW]QCX53907.1 lactate utilization protein B/C [Elizabethkingia sp. JS20170427COW]